MSFYGPWGSAEQKTRENNENRNRETQAGGETYNLPLEKQKIKSYKERLKTKYYYNERVVRTRAPITHTLLPSSVILLLIIII